MPKCKSSRKVDNINEIDSLVEEIESAESAVKEAINETLT